MVFQFLIAVVIEGYSCEGRLPAKAPFLAAHNAPRKTWTTSCSASRMAGADAKALQIFFLERLPINRVHRTCLLQLCRPTRVRFRATPFMGLHIKRNKAFFVIHLAFLALLFGPARVKEVVICCGQLFFAVFGVGCVRRNSSRFAPFRERGKTPQYMRNLDTSSRITPGTTPSDEEFCLTPLIT